MVSISLCMIVKNEEDVLSRCLDSVKDIVDEIIIVDTGSNDTTKKIAYEYTDKVYDFQWIEDFSAARNYAFSLSKSDYCMWLDADDVIEENDRLKLIELKENLSETVAVVMLPYHTGFDEYDNVTFSYYRERIIKNNQGMQWVGAVHEVIEPKGEIIYGDVAVSHRKMHKSDEGRNIRIFEAEIKKGKVLDQRQQFYYGRELYYHKRYNEAITIFEHFLSEGKGWIENAIDACCHCAYCYYALHNSEKALMSFLRTFMLDTPRAEVCCDIGKHFFDRENWRQSAYWYTIATTCRRDDSRGGFTSPDCYNYLPCIQLCVCYANLGDIEKAIKFNELAGKFKPSSDAVEHNKKYFNSLAE